MANKAFIMVLVGALVIIGSYSLSQLPIDAVPDITNNQVQVITRAPALATPEVEQYITTPLELNLGFLPDLVEMRSISRFGLSVITLVFKEDADVYRCRQLVTEQIARVQGDLPPQAGNAELAPISTGLGEIYQYVIRPLPGFESQYTPAGLRTIQDWVVKRQLVGIPGVIEVNSMGGATRQFEVSVNTARLQSVGISISDVFNAVEAANANSGGSYIEKGPNVYFIRGEGRIKSVEDLEGTEIIRKGGIPIRVRDIATVSEGSAVRYGAMSRNGQGEVVGGIIMMLKGSNSAQVIGLVKERVEQVQKSLPEGLVIEPFLDRTRLVNKAINTISTNLLEGGLIVVGVLVLMLGTLRGGLIVASVIPLSLLFAATLMGMFGVSGNLMSLGAIDFGLIVDGAIIVVEGIMHHLGLVKFSGTSPFRKQMDEHVYEASSKIRKSAAFGELIILIVYLPIWALAGVEGKMFKPMAQTVSFCILGALILSLTWVPVASALFLKKSDIHKLTLADKIMARIENSYMPVLFWALRHKFRVVVVSLAMIAIAVAGFFFLGGEFIPTLNEGDFAVELRLSPGSSISQTLLISKSAEKRLLRFPEVKEVVSKVGTSEIPTDPMPFEANDLMVILKEPEDWRPGISRDDLIDSMETELNEIPGISFEFLQPIQMRFNELMTGIKSDVAVKIFGDDPKVLYKQAQKVEGALSGIEGIKEIKVEQTTGLPQLVVSYNRELMASYGVNVKQANTILEAAITGAKAGVVYEGDRRFDLVIRLDSNERKSLESIQKLRIPSENGMLIPMEQVADVRVEYGPAQVSREGGRRRIVVGISVRGRDVESVVNDIKQRLNEKRFLPAGYFYTYGGQFQNLEEAKARLLIAVPAALFIIFLMLYFTFGSVKQTVMIFSAIPLAATGGVLALALRGMPFSISAGVGFIALFGVAVLNGIVLIGYLNTLKTEGWQNPVKRVLYACRVRLRPVIITAMVASFGFLPMAISDSAGAEVQRPLATVVVGGLLFATALTMLVLPVLYLLLEGKIKLKAKPSALAIGVLLIVQSGFAGAQSLPNQVKKGIEAANNYHPALKSIRAEMEAAAYQKNTWLDLPKTRVDFQYGQIQYTGVDYLAGINQSFALPGYYKAFKAYLESLVSTVEANLLLEQNLLARRVALNWYLWQINKKREEWAIRRDSLSDEFLKIAQLKVRTGESSSLEELAAKQEKTGTTQAVFEAKANLQMLESEWERTTGQKPTELIPLDIGTFSLGAYTLSDTAWLNKNPFTNRINKQIAEKEQFVKVEKKTLLPDLQIGYINQSVEGQGNLQIGAIGAGIPLFQKATKNRIKAQQSLVKSLNFRKEEIKNNLKLSWQKAYFEWLVQKQRVELLSGQATQMSTDLRERSFKAFRGGELDYTGYYIAVRQANQIESDYLSALQLAIDRLLELKTLQGELLNP